MEATRTTLDLSAAQWSYAVLPLSSSPLALSKDSKEEGTWLPCAHMPSDIHLELLSASQIPHPYKGWNEHKVQWIGDREWVYRAVFPLPPGGEDAQRELVCEGLDTFCDVYLNGVRVLEADNMFRPYTIPLENKLLKPTNELLLHFKSARKIALDLESVHGKRTAGSVNVGHESRVYVRKAQYHWRWDWGPELMSVGPWLPLHLTTYTTLLTLTPHARVDPSSLSPSLGVSLALSGSLPPKVSIELVLAGAQGEVRRETVEVDTAGKKGELGEVVSWEFGKGEVDLWFPVNSGAQPLYTLSATLSLPSTGQVLDTRSKRIGFRHVELVQRPLDGAPGSSFFFPINGLPIFIGGSCWVPIDNMLPSGTAERYRAWLELMVRGGQNMDFMFACGQYPIHPEFLKSVTEEAEEAVKRLAHRASLVLLCGNNEDYQQVKQWGITELPAVKIYEEILPEVVTRLTDPEIPYHRGSPYGSVEPWDTADPTIGDIHQWEVWAGRADFYQNWDILGGRFVSEFGLPSLPHPETIDYFFDGEQRFREPQSKMMAQHNKAGSYERRFAIYMNENFKTTSDLETYTYLTRLMQGEGIGAAYRMWRRDWKGEGKEYNGGVLVWQINDSWPVASWATVDYFMRPKPAFYATAREMLPITVGIKRTVKKNKENDRPRQFYEFGAFQSMAASIEIWGCNSTLVPRKVILEVQYFDLESDWTEKETKEATLLPNQSTEVVIKDIPHPPAKETSFPLPSTLSSVKDLVGDPLPTPTYSIIVHARLLDAETKEVLSRYSDWPQPFKFLDLSADPGLTVVVSGDKIQVKAEKPLKGLVLDVPGDTDSVQWSDNCIDVVPGDPQTITAKGLGGRKVTVAFLGKEKASLV